MRLYINRSDYHHFGSRIHLDLDWRGPCLVQTEGDRKHREQGSRWSGRDLASLDSAVESDFEPSQQPYRGSPVLLIPCGPVWFPAAVVGIFVLPNVPIKNKHKYYYLINFVTDSLKGKLMKIKKYSQ